MASSFFNRLSTPQKSLLMFTPLVLGFVGLFAFTMDIRNPVRAETFNCSVVQTGEKVLTFNRTSTVLYENSSNPDHYIAFICPKGLGLAVINDMEPFSRSGSIPLGSKANISHKTYHWLPDMWRVNVHANREDCVGGVCTPTPPEATEEFNGSSSSPLPQDKRVH